MLDETNWVVFTICCYLYTVFCIVITCIIYFTSFVMSHAQLRYNVHCSNSWLTPAIILYSPSRASGFRFDMVNYPFEYRAGVYWPLLFTPVPGNNCIFVAVSFNLSCYF